MGIGLKSLKPLIGFCLRDVIGATTHVETSKPLLALTFDDGPHPDVTPALLDVLAAYGAHATFFVLGSAAERHPEIVKRAREAGHAVGNHSFDHACLTKISKEARHEQLDRTESVLARCGAEAHGLKLFRPPFGAQDLKTCLHARKLGLTSVTWNVNSQDWRLRDAKLMQDRLKGAIAPGNVFLFHDALYVSPSAVAAPRPVHAPHVDRTAMLATVTWMLEAFSSEYRFVTVAELLGSGRPVRHVRAAS